MCGNENRAFLPRPHHVSAGFFWVILPHLGMTQRRCRVMREAEKANHMKFQRSEREHTRLSILGTCVSD